MIYSRRDFSRIVAGLAAPALLAKDEVPVALELYSIRKNCAEDFPRSLEAVAGMGYQGVEFAGYHDHSAKGLKQLIGDLGLRASSAHVGYKLLTEEFDSTVDFHQELGVQRLIIPGFRSETADGWRKFADELTAISEKLKPLGMQTGYHNHAHELKPVDGQIPWEIVFDNTPREVIHQADIGHMLRAGADPAMYIKKYAGRTATIHAKDFDPNNEDIVLGEGKMDWKAVLSACENKGGIEWYIVEQEVYPVPPMEAVKQCLENFTRIRG